MLTKIIGKTVIVGKTLFLTSEIPDVSPYNLWDFSNSTGTVLSNVNLSFSPSTTVQINWGDGSIEPISSDTNYSHTLN
jgi:hypothetical protein